MDYAARTRYLPVYTPPVPARTSCVPCGANVPLEQRSLGELLGHVDELLGLWGQRQGGQSSGLEEESLFPPLPWQRFAAAPAREVSSPFSASFNSEFDTLDTPGSAQGLRPSLATRGAASPFQEEEPRPLSARRPSSTLGSLPVGFTEEPWLQEAAKKGALFLTPDTNGGGLRFTFTTQPYYANGGASGVSASPEAEVGKLLLKHFALFDDAFKNAGGLDNKARWEEVEKAAADNPDNAEFQSVVAYLKANPAVFTEMENFNDPNKRGDTVFTKDELSAWIASKEPMTPSRAGNVLLKHFEQLDNADALSAFKGNPLLGFFGGRVGSLDNAATLDALDKAVSNAPDNKELKTAVDWFKANPTALTELDNFRDPVATNDNTFTKDDLTQWINVKKSQNQ